jgi:hypothetical protein
MQAVMVVLAYQFLFLVHLFNTLAVVVVVDIQVIPQAVAAQVVVVLVLQDQTLMV